MIKAKIPQEITTKIYWAKADIRFFGKKLTLAVVDSSELAQQCRNAIALAEKTLAELKAQGYGTD